jgi:hypothetical protein
VPPAPAGEHLPGPRQGIGDLRIRQLLGRLDVDHAHTAVVVDQQEIWDVASQPVSHRDRHAQRLRRDQPHTRIEVSQQKPSQL